MIPFRQVGSFGSAAALLPALAALKSPLARSYVPLSVLRVARAGSRPDHVAGRRAPRSRSADDLAALGVQHQDKSLPEPVLPLALLLGHLLRLDEEPPVGRRVIEDPTEAGNDLPAPQGVAVGTEGHEPLRVGVMSVLDHDRLVAHAQGFFHGPLFVRDDPLFGDPGASR